MSHDLLHFRSHRTLHLAPQTKPPHRSPLLLRLHVRLQYLQVFAVGDWQDVSQTGLGLARPVEGMEGEGEEAEGGRAGRGARGESTSEG